MKNLINYADRYIEQADWKDLALVKVCLCSAGVVLGASVSDSKKKAVSGGAKLLFAATFVPLMVKALSVFLEEDAELE